MSSLLSSLLLLLSSAAVVIVVNAQNEYYDVVKTVDSFLPSSQSADYACILYNKFERDDHIMGDDNVFWAAPILYSHAESDSLWKVGEPASLPVEQYIETGNKRNFIKALQNRSESFDISYDKYLFAIDQSIVFDPISMNNFKRYLSAITRFNPSPDWFSGFYDFDCINPETDSWFEEFELQTYLFDGGTEEGNIFSNMNQPTEPSQPITQFTDNLSDIMKEEFLSETDNTTTATIPPLITFTCKLVGDDGGMGATQSPIFAVLTKSPKRTAPPEEQKFDGNEDSNKKKAGSSSSVGLIIGVVAAVTAVILIAFIVVRRRRRGARDDDNNPYPKNSSYRSGSVKKSKKESYKSYEMKLKGGGGKGGDESCNTMTNITSRSGLTTINTTTEKESTISTDLP